MTSDHDQLDVRRGGRAEGRGRKPDQARPGGGGGGWVRSSLACSAVTLKALAVFALVFLVPVAADRFTHWTPWGMTPDEALMWAIEDGDGDGDGNTAAMARAVADGARCDGRNERGMTPLGVAAITDSRRSIRWLIGRGADVNARLPGDYTPLLLAALASADGESVRLLLAAGADPGARTCVGNSTLLVACQLGRGPAAEALLDAGADVNTRNDAGTSPLAAAAETFDSVPLVRRLIAAGADLEAADHDGVTPLIAAASLGNTEVVEALLAAGADPAAVDRRGRTALAAARAGGHREAASLLEHARRQP